MDLDRGQDFDHETASTAGFGGTGRALEHLERGAMKWPDATRIDRPAHGTVDRRGAPDPSDSAQTSFPIGPGCRPGCATPAEGRSVANAAPAARPLDQDLAALARLFR